MLMICYYKPVVNIQNTQDVEWEIETLTMKFLECVTAGEFGETWEGH